MFVFENEAEWKTEYDKGSVPDGSVIITPEPDGAYGTVDEELSETSENVVMNKAITAGINAVKAMRASETEYGMVQLSSLTDVTPEGTAGKAVPTSELNPAVEGSLMNRISGLNGAYRIRKPHKKNITYTVEAWQPVEDFSYTLPKKSIVIMVVDFIFSRPTKTEMGYFIYDTYFSTEVFEANTIHRIHACTAFIANKNRTINVSLGVSAISPITVYGDQDERMSKADYIVIPLE